MQRLIILLFTSFFLPVALHAQTPLIYNINKYNGLSSNHIYCTHVDQMGYLWLGTSKGVYRYNGYTLKKYDYSDGLSTIDIWSFFEDNGGRLWLQGISDQFGYIKNGYYKSVYQKEQTNRKEVYPLNLFERGNEVMFVKQDNPEFFLIARATADSLSYQYLPSPRKVDYGPHAFFLNTSLVTIYIDSIYFYDINKVLDNNRQAPQPKVFALNSPSLSSWSTQYRLLGSFGNKYYYNGNSKDSLINVYNVAENKDEPIKLKGKNERLVFAFPQDNKLCIISNQNIYRISDGRISDSIKLSASIPDSLSDPFSITCFRENKFWNNRIITTNDNGVYLSYNQTIFEQYDDFLKNYIYVGKTIDDGGIWWNEQAKTLLYINDGVIANRYYLPYIQNLAKIKDINTSKTFLSTSTKAYWLDKASGQLSRLFNSMSVSEDKSLLSYCSECDTSLPFYMRDFDIVDTNLLYYTTAYGGIMSLFLKNGVAQKTTIDEERFQNIHYNTKHKTLLAYSADKIVIINTEKKNKKTLYNTILSKHNIHGIEKVLMDDYGNIYIKEYNKLFLYNQNTERLKRLFSNYILTDAIVAIDHNTLYAAGAFGIIEADATQQGNVAISAVYPNTKNILYKYIKHVQFSQNSILLLTDNGSFFIDKHKMKNNNYNIDTFRVIASFDSTQHILRTNDTFSLQPTSISIDIDVIKPTGTGTLGIRYSINGSSFTNTGYQVILPKLQTDRYYQISLVTYDNNWESKPLVFTIYVQPYWWQTAIATRWFIAGGILLLLAIGYVTFVFTRRMVNKNNDRRNQRRELELKSIYSQINPHFIFNSLSTALYFVRKNKNKEAFEHISQFSQLLRAYIKSSRNKYITISEELINLKNYLELQLSRFEEKFDYEFIVAENVEAENTKVPSLLLQPIVENALNHGIFHSGEKGKLIISFTLSDGVLICKVDDNGIGRKKSKEIRSELIRKADSYGSILIDELINTFNKYEKISISIEYIDKVDPEKGTTVVIAIKNFNLI